MSIHSAITMRFDGDVYVDADDLTSTSVSDAVQVTFSADGCDVFLVGTLDDVQRLFALGDKQCNRMRAARADAVRNGQIGEDLRVLSGEHPVVPEEDH